MTPKPHRSSTADNDPARTGRDPADDPRAEEVRTDARTLPPTDAPGENDIIPRDDEAEEKIGQLTDRLRRVQAEFDNYRKRVERDRVEHSERAGERFVEKLLPVIDHFELGLQAAAPDGPAGPLLEGMKMVLDQLRGVLESEGVSEIDADGADFDPNLHEAVSSLPSPDHPDGVVIHQVRKGYRIGRRLLRPASVVVASNPGDPADGGGTPSHGNVED